MDKDKIFSFYEKAYFRELDDINGVISRFPMLIAGVALIINAYLVSFRLPFFLESIKTSPFVMTVLFIIIFTSIIIMLSCMFKTFMSKDYAYVPALDVIDDWRKQYDDYEKEIKIKNLNSDELNQMSERISGHNLEDALLEVFVQSSAHNRIANTKRKRWFHRTLRWIWINLVLCITIPILFIVIGMWV